MELLYMPIICNLVAVNLSIMRKVFIILITIIVIGMVLFFVISGYTYSEGSRTGYLTKFSKRGYVLKTYEGELNLGGMNAQNNSVMNNLWEFSVLAKDAAAVDSLQHYEGNVVKLYYKQVLKNMPWQGDTDYFVFKVEKVR